MDTEYVEQVLSAVESIPPGRVLSYGDVAELVGSGGPRQVGTVMSRYGSEVPWWRVVRADGRPATGHTDRALSRLRAEGTPLRGDRVDLASGRWRPGTGCPADVGSQEQRVRRTGADRDLTGGFPTGVDL